MPTPKELKWALEDKYIKVHTSSFGVWFWKGYKVLGYDPATDLYACATTKVEGPLEHIKLKAENIEVFVDVIPMESSDDEDDDDEEFVVKVEELIAKSATPKESHKALRAICTEHELWRRKCELFHNRFSVFRSIPPRLVSDGLGEPTRPLHLAACWHAKSRSPSPLTRSR